MTIPNILSGLRLVSVLIFGVLIVMGLDLAAVVVLMIFGGTDWLDGFLARRLKQRTALGAKLDPVADRLYIVVALIALAVRGIVPIWFLLILVLRDVMLTCLVPLLKKVGRTALPVNFVGKAGTFALLVAFPLILMGSSDEFSWPIVGSIGWGIAILGAVLYWWAGALYVVATRRLLKDKQDA